MWQSFRTIGRGNSENAWRKKRKRKKERKKHHEHFISPPVTTVNGRPNNKKIDLIQDLTKCVSIGHGDRSVL